MLFELRDDDLFSWRVYLEGPADTPYVGGVYELTFKFPSGYPFEPPTLKFESEFWHPNVRVCSSVSVVCRGLHSTSFFCP